MRRFMLSTAVIGLCSISDGASAGGGGIFGNKSESKAEAAADPNAKVFAKQDGQDENTRPGESDLNNAEAVAEQQTDLSKTLSAGNVMLANVEVAQAQAGDAEDENQDSVTYTSHPIDNYKFGRFQFKRGQLTLSAEDAAAFDKLLETASARTRSRVRKIDVAAADRLARTFRSTTRTRGVDTSRPGPSGAGA